MLKKGWELIGLVVIIVVALNLGFSAIQPFLPILGIALVLIIVAYIVKMVFFRRKF